MGIRACFETTRRHHSDGRRETDLFYTALALWSARDFIRLSFRTSDVDQKHRPIRRKASLRLAAMPRSAAVMFL